MDNCILCDSPVNDQTGRIVYDDPEYGVIAGRVCVDTTNCQENDE